MFGMSEGEMKSSADYGSEIHRSWRRVLRPLRMPDGLESNEVRIRVEAGAAVVGQLAGTALVSRLEEVLRGFDWHSEVTLEFVDGNGGAAWNRSRRTIRVHGDYLLRFVDQGAAIPR